MRFIITLFLICGLPLHTRASCLRVPFQLTSDMRTRALQIFQNTIVDQFGWKTFHAESADNLTTGEHTIKISRRNPLIGLPPELNRKPRFKKQRIGFTASILDDGSICVEMNARAYNSRDKQWHNIKSDGTVEEMILQRCLFQLVSSKDAWLLGRPPLNLISGGPSLPAAGEHVLVSHARILQKDIKRLQLVLLTSNGTTVALEVAFAGAIQSTADAFAVLSRCLAWSDPFSGIPSSHTFFNAYAVHGELMDGMLPEQVRIALGCPDAVRPADDETETWIYAGAEKDMVLDFRNGELQLTDN